MRHRLTRGQKELALLLSPLALLTCVGWGDLRLGNVGERQQVGGGKNV